MSKRFLSWKTFTESRWLTSRQLLVHEPVLDGRGRAGGHAAQEADLLVGVGLLPGPGPEQEQGQPRASPRVTGTAPRGRRRQGARRSRPRRGGPGLRAGARAGAGRAGPQTPRTARGKVRPVGLAHEEGARAMTCSSPITMSSAASRISSADSSEPRVVVRSSSEISSDIRFRRGPSRPSRRNSSRACWYWKTTGVDKAGPEVTSWRDFLALHEAADVLLRPARRNVTESMILPIRWTPRPPVRRSLLVALGPRSREGRLSGSTGRAVVARPRRGSRARRRPSRTSHHAVGGAVVGVLEHVGGRLVHGQGDLVRDLGSSKPATSAIRRRHVAHEAQERGLARAPSSLEARACARGAHAAFRSRLPSGRKLTMASISEGKIL